jgi:hypothetical protein
LVWAALPLLMVMLHLSERGEEKCDFVLEEKCDFVLEEKCDFVVEEKCDLKGTTFFGCTSSWPVFL